MTRSFLTHAAAIAVLCAAAGTMAADTPASLLPTNPSMWLNSPPLSAEALKGKGVFLWFYEEGCPTCRAKWPGMYELAKKYQGQPVVFIAVNSGNSPAEVAQYAREVKLSWPIIVDPTREFEKRYMDNEISLQNIHQCQLILPSGKKTNGQWSDLEGSVQKALAGASWKIDPQTIPAPFLPTWQQVELGNYRAAADLLKKGLVTKNAEVKEAATRVNAFVQDQIRLEVEAAAKARQDGDAWRAYQLYTGVANTFAGHDLPAEATAAQKELANDAGVKRQIEATKSLDAIKKIIPTAKTETVRKRIIARLQQLTTQFPETEAATEAQRLAGQLAQS
jgi:thiol-disulfide isomerase/thioredoxin